MILEEEVGMSNTKKNLKKHFLTRIKDFNFTEEYDYNKRHMRQVLWDEFDKTWIRYNNNEATFKEWEYALEKWLRLESM
jgi:hypothetical protein